MDQESAMREDQNGLRSARCSSAAQGIAVIAVVVCLLVVVAWFSLHTMKERQRQARLVADLDKLGVQYHYDWLDEWGWARFHSTREFGRAVAELRQSVDPVNAVYLDKQTVDDRMLRTLSDMSTLRELSVRNGRILGSDFSLPQVESLNLVATEADVESINHTFPNTRVLTIDATQLTDGMAETIASLGSIRQLTVHSMNSVDPILPYLGRLKHLHSISLNGPDLNCLDDDLQQLRRRFRVGINGHWYRQISAKDRP